MIPSWIRKYWKDPAFRAFTIIPPLVGIAWDGIISIIGRELFFGTSVLMLIGIISMYVTAYIKRNSPW